MGSRPNDQGSASFAKIDGRWQRLWFLCDATDAAELYLVDPPKSARVTIARHALPGLARTGLATYTLGRADPGAGNVYFALAVGGREVGNLHAVNAQMIDPPPRVPSFTSLQLGATRRQCRSAPGTLLIGVTPRRTVMVSAEGGKLLYRAFPLDGRDRLRPSLVLTTGVAGEGGWSFTAGRHVYRLGASQTGDGGITILRDGRVIGTEPLLAYSVAPR